MLFQGILRGVILFKRYIQRRTAFSELCQKVHCFSEVQLAGGVTRAQFLFAVMQPSLHRDFMYTVHTQRCTVVSEVYSEVYCRFKCTLTGVLLLLLRGVFAVSEVHSQVYCCYTQRCIAVSEVHS